MPIVIVHSPVDQLVNLGLNAGNFAAGQENAQLGLQGAHLAAQQSQFQQDLALRQQQADYEHQYRAAEIENQRAAWAARMGIADQTNQGRMDRAQLEWQARQGIAGGRNQTAEDVANTRAAAYRDVGQGRNDLGYYKTDANTDLGYYKADLQSGDREARIDQGYDSMANRPDYAANEDLRARQAQFNADKVAYEGRAKALNDDVLADQHQMAQLQHLVQANPYSPAARQAQQDLATLKAGLPAKIAALQAHLSSPPSLGPARVMPRAQRFAPEDAAVGAANSDLPEGDYGDVQDGNYLSTKYGAFRVARQGFQAPSEFGESDNQPGEQIGPALRAPSAPAVDPSIVSFIAREKAKGTPPEQIKAMILQMQQAGG